MDVCSVCKQPLDVCPYGGDCGEVRYIYRQQQKEKLADIDIDECTCDVCGYTYGERTHDQCHDWGD